MRWIIAGITTLLTGLCLHTPTMAQGTFIRPELTIGWLEDSGSSAWTLRRQASTGATEWKRSGWWLEARTGLSLGPNSDLLVSGGWFLPRPASGVWHTNQGPYAVAFDIDSYQWGTMDALLRYRARQGRLDLLSGVRWDKKRTRVHFSDDTEDDYRLNTYALVLGAQLNQPAGGGMLSVRVLGSPLVVGRMNYKFRSNASVYEEHGDFRLDSGYALECRAQYSHPIGKRWMLGSYAQWSTQRLNTGEAALSGMTTEPVSWKVAHSSWTMGITASMGLR